MSVDPARRFGSHIEIDAGDVFTAGDLENCGAFRRPRAAQKLRDHHGPGRSSDGWFGWACINVVSAGCYIADAVFAAIVGDRVAIFGKVAGTQTKHRQNGATKRSAFRIENPPRDAGEAQKEKLQTGAGFAVPKRNRLAGFPQTACPAGGGADSFFGGAQIVLAGRQPVKSEFAGTVGAPGSPGARRTLPKLW